jgi:Ni,Fe-hydrogenase III large subunit
MMQGAREGTMNGLRRLVAAAMSRDLCAFVIPGPDVARAAGLDFAAAGLHLSATPRHANVLLITGPLPSGLIEAATSAYAQMPRPRTVLALGAGDLAPLPAPDATGPLSQSGLVAALAELRPAIAAGAFSTEVTDFDAPSLGTRIEYTCPMHPEVVSDKPGNCPKCGMTLMPKETAATGHSGHQMANQAPPEDHGSHDQSAPFAEPGKYTCPMHPEVVSDQPGNCPKCGMTLVKSDAAADHDHGGHGKHGSHDHDHSDAAAQYTCPMHPEVVSDQPGNCPKCGMTLVKSDAAADHDHGGHGEHAGQGHASHTETAAQYTCPMHPEVVSDQPGNCPKCGMFLVPAEAKNDHGGHEGGHHHGAAKHGPTDANDAHIGHGEGHAGHGAHGGHAGHSAQGEAVDGVEANFMSMVDLTRDQPASPDGLKMEWITVPFGPFFPGLPGGLGLALTLDGDTVVEAQVQSLASANLNDRNAPRGLADRLADLSPLAPVAMRQLACLALAAAAGKDVAGDKATPCAAAVERERITSHLNWLAGFATQTGMNWMERRAAALQLALRQADATEIATRAGAIRAFLLRVRATPLLRDKLAGIGKLDSETAATGPVARAAGVGADARADDPIYQALGFDIVTQSAGDAWARLHQRLDEIAQSLDLIARAGTIAMPVPGELGAATGHGMAEVETPRGPARLHLTLNEGRVETAEITTPFAVQSGLIDAMTAQTELADALTAIGSLDLDPWEIAP